MAIEVFTRYEYKYLINSEILDELKSIFSTKLEVDSYCKKNDNYKIINYYVDTINNQLIRSSLDKPLYKHKLRLRSYEEIQSVDDFVYFEIKKKFKGLVGKRRCKVTFKDAMAMIYEKKMPKIEEYMNVQILKEIFYILNTDEYKLSSKIIYDRIAYFSSDKKLRISFDFNIHSESMYHLEENNFLMEIKTPDAIPLWLARELDKLKIKSVSFSKYGQDFENNIKKEKEDEQYTIN